MAKRIFWYRWNHLRNEFEVYMVASGQTIKGGFSDPFKARESASSMNAGKRG